ncbi:MAG TPA: hypothetical protein VKV17_08855 [Bryobacteraceae bacterium]|nr:hypothetical protein [Bryobacteraceae bacterium]
MRLRKYRGTGLAAAMLLFAHENNGAPNLRARAEAAYSRKMKAIAMNMGTEDALLEQNRETNEAFREAGA